MAAQRALELPVRMGLATGEAELRDGDYFGAVLNRAARVMASGHGGQVLLDGTTAGLCSSIDLIALGPRRLRDIAKPVEMFQVLAVGLRSEFPPLKTLDATPGNLRPPTTSFIGREAELAEVQEALKAHRLVTLTGVGGVGKTRLATEVAARLADGFPDGVWLFELAAVTDPAAVPDAVAAVLGITQQPGKSLADSAAAALEGRVRLLVFDNCEHVRDAAADLVEAILAHSATVRVLATSREGLGVADEQLWLVPSLEVRAGIDSAAVSLFVERARSVASRFSVATADEAAAVVEICQRLDGIPLAIELAASRMASMTASEVRDRLDQRFRLLVGSRRGLERHQTLRHTVAWSYDLLDDDEKALLERCSVFAGGFDLQSACAVAGFDQSTTTPCWICWTPWCVSRYWSPTDHRGGPGFRCWRRSASSPRNNSSPPASTSCRPPSSPHTHRAFRSWCPDRCSAARFCRSSVASTPPRSTATSPTTGTACTPTRPSKSSPETGGSPGDGRTDRRHYRYWPRFDSVSTAREALLTLAGDQRADVDDPLALLARDPGPAIRVGRVGQVLVIAVYPKEPEPISPAT